MSKIIKAKLGEICIQEKGAVISGPFGSNISSKYFKESGIPVIRGNNLSLSMDKFYDTGFVFISEEKANELKCDALRGDIIFTAAGTIGQVGIIPENSKYSRYVISNKQIRARIDVTKVDLLYAYYWFSSPWIKKVLTNSNKGSTVPLLTLHEVKTLPICYPEDLDEQRNIAEIIDTITNKIENNKIVNSEIEDMAKAIYDYWFLQYDFPDENGKPYKSSGGKMIWNEELKREIPEGWEVADLKDIASITMGTSPKGDSINTDGKGIIFYQGKADFGSRFPITRTYTNAPIRYADINDILLSVRAPVGTINIANKKCCIGRGLAAIHSKYGSFMYYLLLANQYKFDIYNNGGTTFGAITKDSLFGMRVVIPKESVIEKFEKRAKCIDQEIFKNNEEKQELVSLRDFLLPLLMSGQVGFKQ